MFITKLTGTNLDLRIFTQAKKSGLVSENCLSCPCSRMCIRIYIFCFKPKNTHTHKQKVKETKEKRKTKETKEEKEKENVVVNNICGKSSEIP